MAVVRLPSILAIFTVLLMSCATVDTPDSDTVSVLGFDKALQAANRGDYAAAMQEWRPPG
jgi:hypothetical protein